MRFLFILLFASSASAQYLSVYKDSAVMTTLDLPKKEPFDTSRSYARMDNEFVYICSQADLYDVFGFYISTKYHDFDFSETHILGMRINDEWVWLMRDNKTAFTEIPISITPGHVGPELPGGRHSFLKDTVIMGHLRVDRARWYTNGNGDCFASFNYGLFKDRYHPVLLLREWNHWGGCRAGGFFDFTLSFAMPAGIKYKLKSRTLED